MVRIIWTEPALQEIDEIADYISLDNPSAAKKMVREVFNRVDDLTHFPLSGKQVSEIEISVYREIILPPCRIFYRLENDTVYIIHIIRSEQYLHLDLLQSR